MQPNSGAQACNPGAPAHLSGQTVQDTKMADDEDETLNEDRPRRRIGEKRVPGSTLWHLSTKE